MAKVIAYIDGFNFYYGAVKTTPFKWLDFGLLLQNMFPADQIDHIKYFTARVKPRRFNQNGPIRQQIYWRALRTIPNFSIIEGSFLTNKKHLPVAAADRYALRARLCRWLMPDLKYNRDGVLLVRVLKTEEKGSDVNLAAHLINDAHFNRFQEAVVVSGDSDLCDALRIVTKEIGKPVRVVNPQFRVSRELQGIASHYRHVHGSELKRSQFPTVLTDTHGMFNKPHEWR